MSTKYLKHSRIILDEQLISMALSIMFVITRPSRYHNAAICSIVKRFDHRDALDAA